MNRVMNYDPGYEPAGFDDEGVLIVRHALSGREFAEPTITDQTIQNWRFNAEISASRDPAASKRERGLGRATLRAASVLLGAGVVVGLGYSVTKHAEAEFFDADALPNVVKAFEDPIEDVKAWPF